MSTNLVVLASRPPDWTQERFTRWWRGEHADMARQLPGLLSYRHGVVVHDYGRAGAPAWDGHAVLGFADRQALDAAMASPQWAAAVAHAGGMKGRRLVLITEEVDLLTAAAASR
jgi:uncharacterized protein (TIGR02118 family)